MHILLEKIGDNARWSRTEGAFPALVVGFTSRLVALQSIRKLSVLTPYLHSISHRVCSSWHILSGNGSNHRDGAAKSIMDVTVVVKERAKLMANLLAYALHGDS